jgi:outer membrane protein assembly factor BamB
MNSSDLLFIGIKGSVVALHRDTGDQVWATHLKGSDFVNVVSQDGKIFATCCGEVFCLKSMTGEGLWHNRLKGLGTGLATIAGEDSLRQSLTAILAEKERRDQAAATAAASGTA